MRKLFLLITVVVLLSGCAGTPWYPLGSNWDPWKQTDLEAAFGKAYQAAIANQTLDPDASTNLSPVIGMDGKSAEKELEMYRKSFQEEQINPTYIFNVGQGATK